MEIEIIASWSDEDAKPCAFDNGCPCRSLEQGSGANAFGANVEKRVDSLLSQMTVDEKIEMLGGINDFYTRAIPRLGIPSLKCRTDRSASMIMG